VKSKSLACLALLSSVLAVVAQTSTFTYQGQLSANGNPAGGLFDLRFTLYDAATAGNQVGNALTNAPLIVSNGVFTTTLDFGNGAFDGSLRWLQIGLRTNGDANPYLLLAPRQLLTSTPYAIRAANFAGPLGTTNLTGKISDTNLSANVALLNASNATFLGSISATNFYGYGGGLTNVPGRIFEVIPTGVNIQAFANFGYLATNNTTAVVVTLPATANIRVGETIRVSGGGAGGWIVAQNAGQSILVGNLLTTVGVNWTTNGSALSWKAIASSSDGSKLVAATSGGGGQIYTSTNYGATWTPRAVLGNISSVASSGDGTKLVATVNGGFIQTSIDSGASWVSRTASGARNWTGVASSLDGTRLAACSSQGIFVSADSGASWPASPQSVATWSGIASSADGSNLVAVIQGGVIGVSTNAGATWAARGSNGAWTCVASSSDGGVLVAGANTVNNFLYTSTDFGTTWVPAGPGQNWTGVACSSDGSRMIAVANGGGVYVSMDTGVTWLQRGNLPTGSGYTGAAASSDGSTMAAVAVSNVIYVSSQSATAVGVTGGLVGTRLAAVELQHVGNGVFIPISFVGTIRAN
jgi:hypothetical protein